MRPTTSISRRGRRARVAGIIGTVVALLVAAFWLLGEHSGIALPAYADRHQHIAEAYRFAAEHRDLLTRIPCTCGCDAIGHRNNADCYIKTIQGNRITWDPHAAV